MKSEILARLFVLLLVTGSFSAVILARFLQTRSVVELHGKIAEKGGWTPEVLHTEAGQPLRLRLTSDDVTHGFAIGQSDEPAVDVLPGMVSDLTLIFDKPGLYTFYCTRWCGLNHWRMRGTIEVIGKDAQAQQSPTKPLYVTLGLDLDAPHPAAVFPGEKPVAETVYPSGLADKYLQPKYFQSHAPSQVFSELRQEAGLAALDDSQLWALIASIWKSNTTPEALTEAGKLYASNCAACHGQTGQGDGIFADQVAANFGKNMPGMRSGRPVDFSKAESMLGASPALLQGKILRGGMGTGMPMWGSIFTGQQTWSLVAYLYSFSMNYR